MKQWQILAAKSNLPKRFFYHPFVFKDKIWIIGGNDGSNHFDGANNFSDIWNSIDGEHWQKQADSLPFGKREHSQFVLFNDKIYLLNNDVWASSDGLKWSKVTDRLAKENIFGYTAIVYDNRIWLLGCNRDGVFPGNDPARDCGSAGRTSWHDQDENAAWDAEAQGRTR
jgi:hypothetical protein